MNKEKQGVVRAVLLVFALLTVFVAQDSNATGSTFSPGMCVDFGSLPGFCASWGTGQLAASPAAQTLCNANGGCTGIVDPNNPFNCALVDASGSAVANLGGGECDSSCPPGEARDAGGLCAVPLPQCTLPQVFDPVIGFCVTPPDCSNTTGQGFQGGLVAAGAIGNTCSGGCEYQPSDFTFQGTNTGFWTYSGTGNACAGGAPAPVPLPPPETPITPTPPEPSIPNDNNTTNEPASDEGQETISNQLGGVQNQLQNLEKGTGSLITQGNQQNSLLQQIANKVGQGTGTKGPGTSDENGDGVDDSFTDGGCLGPPACNGPVIQCAIAAQAYATRCNLEDDTVDITEADVMLSTNTTLTLEQYFDSTNPSNQIDVTNSFTVPAATTSACPPDNIVQTSYGNVDITYSYICQFGTTVRPVVILGAWLIVGMMFYTTLLRNF